MTKIKAMVLLACSAPLLLGCPNSSMPKKSNVLNGSSRAEKKLPAQSNQTVFAKPDGNTKNKASQSGTVITKEDLATASKISEDKTSNFNTSNLVYGSPQYYKYKADSLQAAYSKKDYAKNVQAVIDQIVTAPYEKVSPAINTDQWYAAIDFDVRKPNFVILHHTGQNSAAETLHTFSLRRPGKESSAHYVVARDGKVYQLLNDYLRSWHAGASQWGNITDMNSCSLGIEVDNNGKDQAYSDQQIASLIKLLSALKEKYKIPQANFLAHSDIAPGRKEDPGIGFPWKQLADAGFGYWYDNNNLKELPSDFDPVWALRLIGYNVTNPSKAISAFKHHYLQVYNSEVLTMQDKKIIYNIALQYK